MDRSQGVYVLPEGQEGNFPPGAGISPASGNATEPFKFTFDPSEAATDTKGGD